MNLRVLGSVFLIVAMSIGGGLLSLPFATSTTGLMASFSMMFLVWLVMTCAAFYILEVCLSLPRGANLMSMAQVTLRKPYAVVFTACYLCMLYSILCVYLSGGTDLVNSVFLFFSFKKINILSTCIFMFALGVITWCGMRWVDYTNRLLMCLKALFFLMLVVSLSHFTMHTPHWLGHTQHLPSIVMPIIFSFGYAIIIPSLRDYLDDNVRQLRYVIFIGSLIPLMCFYLWVFLVQSVIPHDQILKIAKSGEVVSGLNLYLAHLKIPMLTMVTHCFTTICLLTAFLGVSLSLSDFLADLLSREKKGKNKVLIFSLTFLPPLFLTAGSPDLFLEAIQYAGIFVVVVLMAYPIAMAFSARKNNLTNKTHYKFTGGYPLMAFLMLVTILFLCVAVYMRFFIK